MYRLITPQCCEAAQACETSYHSFHARRLDKLACIYEAAHNVCIVRGNGLFIAFILDIFISAKVEGRCQNQPRP